MTAAGEPKEIPNEVWIEILSSGELSYYDLKRVRGVSKTFKAIYELVIFDETLFRGKPESKLAQGTRIKLHPTLWDDNSGFIGEDLHQFWAGSWEDEAKQWEIAKLACASEFATYPPVHTIYLKLGGDETVKNANGVTVKDVIEGIAAAWGKKAYFDVQDPVDSDGESVELMSFAEELSMHDHQFWEGWEDPKLSKKGGVILKPHWYGS
ncbi:hypothetical protein P7C70_g7151, partial [Phenoliferia sp. Uapishka_3]